MKKWIVVIGLIAAMFLAPALRAQEPSPAPAAQAEAEPVKQDAAEYLVGIDDILEIHVISPESINLTVTVSPDGSVTFPYIGMIIVKDKTLTKLQDEITTRLAEGYMKYPVVNVILKESRSRRFFVYGEVIHPGTYPIEQNTTVMRAISVAGGFTKFGSSSRVKVLRARKDGAGYEPLKINIKDVMNGNANADISIHSGDIVVVSEGVF
jgi:polysaccharide export outer membrane protein